MDLEAVRLDLLAALEREAASHGADVVDVEATLAGGQAVVCVRVDHADEALPPITLDEVSSHTGWVSDVVEACDPFDRPYVLEVSSPGLDRPLRRERDFERFAGERVSLVTRATEGRRRYTGELLGMRDGRVALSCDDGEFDFALGDVRSCTIKPTFDFSAPAGKRSDR